MRAARLAPRADFPKFAFSQLAESVGFEPTVPVRGHLVSSEALSTTQPTLQKMSIN